MRDRLGWIPGRPRWIRRFQLRGAGRLFADRGESRIPYPLKTRLACLSLFLLAIVLAGAASNAVQGMASPKGYEPSLLSFAQTENFAVLDARDLDPSVGIDLAFREDLADDPPPPPRPVPPKPRPAGDSTKQKTPPPPPKPVTSTKVSAPSSSKAASKTVSEPLPPAPPVVARHLAIRDRSGAVIVGRLYGQDKDRIAAILPDGQIGFIDGLIETKEPFVPATIDQLRDELSRGEYKGFKVSQTKHYLVFYGGSERFALASAKVLEDLYVSLANALRKKGFAVHESEFPLIAVIYATEEEFRARKRVAREVQAYYEILSNRIFLYENSQRDQVSPETSLLRKPQTVAHEGAHQILQNIGVQPRLADWPLWLVEGFAEYCSPPKMTKSGVDWAGLNQINPLHMATIRDLDDPLSIFVSGGHQQPIRDPNKSWIETLVSKRELTPTDYALSWALTHYLANKRLPEFLEYLKEMSRRPPLERRSPADHLADFQKTFGKNLGKMDSTVATYLSKLKKFDVLPYYTVLLEQPLNRGLIRRATMVSQSPSMIQQWIEASQGQSGSATRWQIVPYPTRTRAILHAQEWMASFR